MDSKKKNRIITIIALGVVALLIGASYYLDYKYPQTHRAASSPPSLCPTWCFGKTE